MALQKKKVVKTYGKKSQKTIVSDNWWVSPQPKASKVSNFSTNAFSESDQSNDSTQLEERNKSEVSVMKDESNTLQEVKELQNLFWAELEESRQTCAVLVPETPESKMKTHTFKKSARIQSTKTVDRNNKETAKDKENVYAGKKTKTTESSKIEEKAEHKEKLAAKKLRQKPMKDKEISSKKKNIKKNGRRVSIFHRNLPVLNLDEVQQCSPCEVLLSRLKLDDVTPTSSSPKVRLSQCDASIHENDFDNISGFIPGYLSPVKSLSPFRSNDGKIVSFMEKVLLHCGQSETRPFSSLFTKKELSNCRKIGEGVYGEVFTIERNGEMLAVKIIPIEGELIVNDEKQKTFEEILPEIVISKELSFLREQNSNGQTDHFIEVKGVHCCRGQFLPELLREWDAFDEKKGSENDRPDSYTDSQLFIVFMFANGGSDLEAFKFQNVLEKKCVLQQTIEALAVAEKVLQFEHRDLHWGNVLVKKLEDDEQDTTLPGHRLHVSIIDFTLSRLHKDECTLFFDLSTDESIFEGEGDYQFDIYRLMRDHNNNKWDQFNPYSNVLWLHYLTKKLIDEKKVVRSRKKVHIEALHQLKAFEQEVLKFKSAEDVFKSSNLFT
ncbi:serine/threonine-protein kinase haspin-like isoform X2 [Antedon mediterranea]|uniref:serine/threonine-protein kinase haspin-like isoform X2 n=1 Tax=Antedon mediterranea TaxID=105859 RepID=UPI003AF67D69